MKRDFGTPSAIFRILGLLVASNAIALTPPAAPFTGHWMGRGRAVSTLPVSKTRNCSQIELSLAQDPHTLSLNSGSYTCQDLRAQYDAAKFEIRGQTLWNQGQRVGTIASNRISLSVVDPEDGSTFKLTLTASGVSSVPALDYLEQWLDHDQLALEIKGTLIRNRSVR